MERVNTRLVGKPYTPLAKSHFQGASRAERLARLGVTAFGSGVLAESRSVLCPKIDSTPVGSSRVM